MTPEDMKKEFPCETAEDLLREMSPSTGRLWASSRDGRTEREWIFRGIPDANFELRPSAFRRKAFTSFIPGQVERRIDDADEQRGMEDCFLTQFCTEADRMEIQIPSDRPELRDSRRALQKYDPHEFPPIDKLHMYALAQHYGVPTRLLDWSRHPLVAAYFAVRDVAMVRTKRPGGWSISGNEPCAVWALDATFLRVMMGEATKNEAIDPAVYLVGAPEHDETPTTEVSFPLAVQIMASPNTPLSGVDQVSIDQSHACAVRSGAVYCWGRNYNGALGAGDTTDRVYATAVTGLPATVTKVLASLEFTCALAGGELYCWGGDLNGQLGDLGSISTGSKRLAARRSVASRRDRGRLP
jgi:hypothetical protein